MSLVVLLCVTHVSFSLTYIDQEFFYSITKLILYLFNHQLLLSGFINTDNLFSMIFVTALDIPIQTI